MMRLNDLVHDCFVALIQVRGMDPSQLPPPEVLHQRFQGFITTMFQEAERAGIDRLDAQDAAYAIAALVDEVVLSLAGPVRGFWMTRPLQLVIFNENTAGDGFFIKLEELRTNPRRIQVFEVYYLCLLFGFQGRYRVRGGEAALAEITQGVEAEIARIQSSPPDALSPRGIPLRTRRTGARRAAPVIAMAVVAAVCAVGLYIGLRLSLRSETRETVGRIQQVTGQ